MGAWGGKGDTSSGGTWGNSHLEVRGEVKQRPGPTVWGAVGSPRGELDAEVPRPTQVSSALSLNSCPPHLPIPQALERSLSP